MTKQPSHISILRYDEEGLEEISCQHQTLKEIKRQPGIKWINIDGTENTELIESVGQVFGLHALMVEDIISEEHRPKLDDYDQHLFVVLNMLSYDEHKHEIISEQISLVLGDDYVISFQEADKTGDVFDRVRTSLRNNKGKIRRSGSDYLLYSLLDTVVDNYFVILEKIGERLEPLETGLALDSEPSKLRSLYKLKRETISLRRSVWPLREVLGRLERDDCELVKENTRIYLRDVYDHTIQVIDGVESFRESLSSLLDLHLSVTSNKMNNVMKVLTVISTIFMPLTFIVGVYGMNFDNMPELHWTYGYFEVMGVCLLISIGMIFYFRKKRWL